MSLMLGNLTVDQMQRKAGVTFPDELVIFMNGRHQEKANNVQPGKWHCFDIPFALVCGDMETASHIYSYLSPLSSKFIEQMQISLSP